MSRTLSPSFARCYGLARVARVWKVSRASVYRSLKETPPNTVVRRRGPLGEDTGGPPLRRSVVAEDSFALLLGDAEGAALKPGLARVGEHLEPAGERAIAADGLSAWADVFRTIQGFEAWQSHGAWIKSEDPEMTPPVRGRFEIARGISAEDCKAASTQRAGIREQLLRIVGDDRVILLPTLPMSAPPLNSDEADFETFRSRALQLLCPAGLSGFPQISLPLGVVEGCPIGLSLIAPPGRDRALIDLAGKILGDSNLP